MNRLPWLVMMAWFAPAAMANPNVLVIIADDLGVRNVGAYVNGPDGVQGTPPPTPHIDSIGAAGVRYANAWAAPVCSPMRASFLTGRHPSRHGVGFAIGAPGDPELQAGEVTLPEALAPAGVTSAWIGKWHLDTNPVSPQSPNINGFSFFSGAFQGALPSYVRWPKTEQGVQSICTTYATTDSVNEARDFIRSATSPWFCVVALNAPHTPFHVPPHALYTTPLNGTPLTNPNGHYRAMIEAMDTEIGRLFAETRGGLQGLLRDTWVIFVADNGTPPAAADPPLEPQTRIKGTVYEGGIKVPLLVAGPGVSRPGRVRHDLVSVVDLFPTIGDMMGVDVTSSVPADRAFDGVSFVAGLRRPAGPPARTVAYAETFQGDPWADGQSAARNARHKLVRTGSDFELYDLSADPLESTDLLASGPAGLTPDQRASFEQLRAVMFGIVPPPACDCDLDGDFDADLQDLSVFVARWAEGDADFNGDGVQDRDDLRAFNRCVRSGC